MRTPKKSVSFADSDFPFAQCMVGDDDSDTEGEARRKGKSNHKKASGLSAQEEIEFQEVLLRSKELGIDLFDPQIQKLIKALGDTDGELNPEDIERVLNDQELEANLKITEVIVDGIDESTFPAMLNTRIRGDENSLLKLKCKTEEELRIMLCEALARDLPVRDATRSKNDWEEDIVDVINTLYGSFVLKPPPGLEQVEKRSNEWTRLRQTYLPYICMAVVLLYTAIMYYHDPESYTNYDASKMQHRPGMKRPSAHEDL